MKSPTSYRGFLNANSHKLIIKPDNIAPNITLIPYSLTIIAGINSKMKIAIHFTIHFPFHFSGIIRNGEIILELILSNLLNIESKIYALMIKINIPLIDNK